jgi:uncharacterized protein
MPCTAIPAATLAAAAEALRGYPEVTAAYLLGSAAADRLRPESDVDVAILPARRSRLSIPDRLAIADKLSQVFGREVDLGFLSTTNLVYTKEAITAGRLLVDRDPSATAEFAMHALAMYAALQEERREVLRAYAA